MVDAFNTDQANSFLSIKLIFFLLINIYLFFFTIKRIHFRLIVIDFYFNNYLLRLISYPFLCLPLPDYHPPASLKRIPPTATPQGIQRFRAASDPLYEMKIVGHN